MTLIKTWNVVSYGLSDIGLTRHKNEDAWARDLSCHVYALADGIGGRQAGEVASHYAVNRICQIIAKDNSVRFMQRSEDICSFFCESIQQANTEIFEMAAQNEFLKGMGTTLCSLLIHEEVAYTAHVGDSRIYLLRSGRLTQLTEDHKPGCCEAPSHYISKALGVKDQVQPSVEYHQVQEGDLFLLCSDGLSNALSTEQILQVLAEESPLRDKCHNLINHAKREGGSDNITALLIHLKP